MTERTEYGTVGCRAITAVRGLSVSSSPFGDHVLSVFDRTYLCLFRKIHWLSNILNSRGFACFSDFRKRSSGIQKGSSAIIRNPEKREFWNKMGVLELSDARPDSRNGVSLFSLPFGGHVLSVFDRTYLCLFRNFSSFCNLLNFSALESELKFEKGSSEIQKGSSAIIRNPAKGEFYNKMGVLKSSAQIWQRKRTRKG